MTKALSSSTRGNLGKYLEQVASCNTFSLAAFRVHILVKYESFGVVFIFQYLEKPFNSSCEKEDIFFIKKRAILRVYYFVMDCYPVVFFRHSFSWQAKINELIGALCEAGELAIVIHVT